MRVLWFGTYSVGPGYPRNIVLIEALRSVGVEVVECHAPLFSGAADKLAATSSLRGAARFGARALGAWARLAARWFRAGERDVVVVGYTGHLDLFLARALAMVWRRPVVLDAFLSPFDTVVNDRRLLAPESRAARALFAFEKASLRLADMVLTDTRASADWMASTFGVSRRRFVDVAVGSLVRRRAPVRVPVVVGAPGSERPPFSAFFCGTFVPLQGIPYLLDAAELAPDLRFRIVGDGADAPRVAEELERRGMQNVEWERCFVPREEMERRMLAADAVLGVFGATDKSRRVVPCKVYDGLAAGMPVVTGDGPGPRELMQDGRDALLVDRGDPRALVAALRRLRDEEALSERLRAGARRLARVRFGRQALGWRLAGALRRLAGEGRGR